jgi:hypothetical protein
LLQQYFTGELKLENEL